MIEVNITRADRIDIIKQIVSNDMFLGDYKDDEGGILTFLEMIWDLRSMPSQDNRYTNARSDIWKHIVVNDDITIEELFLDRLPSSYEDDSKFVSLINATVHPSVIHDEEKRKIMIGFINTIFDNFDYKLIITDYFGDTPVYTFCDNSIVKELPKDIKPNDIKFYKSSYDKKTYPCFVLEFNSDWNDWFQWKTSFHLLYFKSNLRSEDIGYLKIMKINVDNTNSVLPDSFFSLDSTYCSIGADDDFYLTMKNTLPKDYYSVFLALRDAAIFPSIREEFENDDCFKSSLLRNSEPKQLLDSARYIMNGIDISSYYKFSYSFLAPYSPQDKENIVNLDFNFKYGSDFDQRVYAIIGKNGTGKTTMLCSMANDFALANPKTIIPQKPLYNKVITISFSFFDKLPLPKSNAQFNYTYLGLKSEKHDKDINKTLNCKLKTYLKSINDKKRSRIWKEFANELFHSDINDNIIETNDYTHPIDIDKVLAANNCFSSGENLLLYIISSIISEIQNNTLILFDEPEDHLHPNAISILMNVLYKLLDDFNSFAILATHSPIVIQEVSSRNVKVLKREGNLLEVSNIEHETFSESLTTITDEIFGNREIAKYHTNVMKNIVNAKSKDKTYNEIVDIFKNDQIPSPLNLKLYLKELINEKS